MYAARLWSENRVLAGLHFAGFRRADQTQAGAPPTTHR
jgi:hypothetical protein